MNGIEKITARITAEAEEAAAAVIAGATEAAAAVTAEYEKKAAAAYEARLAAGKAELEQDAQRLDRAARLDGKKDVLALKRSLLEKAYEAAKEKILSLDGDAYAAFLARECGKAAVSGHEQVILNAKDRAAHGEAVVKAANELLAARGLPGALTLSDDVRDFSGGVVLREGAVEVNSTLDSLLELGRNALDAEVAGVLFR